MACAVVPMSRGTAAAVPDAVTTTQTITGAAVGDGRLVVLAEYIAQAVVQVVERLTQIALTGVGRRRPSMLNRRAMRPHCTRSQTQATAA